MVVTIGSLNGGASSVRPSSLKDSGMQATAQVSIPQGEYLELYRLYMAYRSKAEELCRRYGVEAQLVIFTP